MVDILRWMLTGLTGALFVADLVQSVFYLREADRREGGEHLSHRTYYVCLCAFFGDCGTQGLRWIAETDNALWERIERREPNAYLVLLYWDSEMFRRSSKKRSEMERDEAPKDYKALCKDILFLHPERYTIAPDTKKHMANWRSLFIKTSGVATQKHYKRMYEGLLYGDPKSRVLRILWTEIYTDYNQKPSGKGVN